MDYIIHIEIKSQRTKVSQIISRIKLDIERGVLKRGEQLPSITVFSRSNGVAKETIEKAYSLLQKEGYLESVPGKGNFVKKRPSTKLKILMVFNKLSTYKKEVYEAFLITLGKNARVDLQIYHYDPTLFKQIIEDHLGRYHYYVVMPHFFSGIPEAAYMDTLARVAPEELIILDKALSTAPSRALVYQDFRLDIYEAFKTNFALFDPYHSITLVFAKMGHHPMEIVTGIREFCEERKMRFDVVSQVGQIEATAGVVYVTLNDTDLASLIMAIRKTSLSLGKDLGVVSFNETVLKALLGITVVSTDFYGMGKKAAQMILSRKPARIRNSFSFINRGSL
jgi:DNA-binding transcriptional regulator YhcF (GntR family)